MVIIEESGCPGAVFSHQVICCLDFLLTALVANISRTRSRAILCERGVRLERGVVVAAARQDLALVDQQAKALRDLSAR